MKLRNRKAKIVATLGPACETEKAIEKLFLSGADVFRLNFSHGDHEDHKKKVKIIRDLEKKYELKNGMCAITDEAKVLGLGGIMGGESTGCGLDTKNVFLESALFDEVNTAKTGRNLSILSDARYRFERGIDPNSTSKGIDLATQLKKIQNIYILVNIIY